MSASTLSYTAILNTVIGDQRLVIKQVAFSAGYVTDGFAITASALGMVKVNALVPVLVSAVAGVAVLPSWDVTAGKLVLYGTNNDADNNPLQQLANDATITGVKVWVLAFGY